jgi:hypothetical protein
VRMGLQLTSHIIQFPVFHHHAINQCTIEYSSRREYVATAGWDVAVKYQVDARGVFYKTCCMPVLNN